MTDRLVEPCSYAAWSVWRLVGSQQKEDALNTLNERDRGDLERTIRYIDDAIRGYDMASEPGALYEPDVLEPWNTMCDIVPGQDPLEV
jgi:hypothetical protein